MDNHPQNGKTIRSVRNLLVALNRDLFTISEYMRDDYNVKDYTEFEYLVMAIEDRRYLTHCGVDLRSIVRESVKAICFKKHGGASTVDMQLVRTITNFKENSFFRKMYESILACLINYKYSKKQIIRCYLDNAFFGSGIYSSNDAAIIMYSMDRECLSIDQKSFIAAMLLRPKPLKPSDKWHKLVLRRALYAQSVRHLVKKRNN
jgi:membrane peptidoglycan carboxypeptidase